MVGGCGLECGCAWRCVCGCTLTAPPAYQPRRMVAKNGPYGVYFEMDTPSGLERANCPEAWDPTTATAAQVAELFTLKARDRVGWWHGDASM